MKISLYSGQVEGVDVLFTPYRLILLYAGLDLWRDYTGGIYVSSVYTFYCDCTRVAPTDSLRFSRKLGCYVLRMLWVNHIQAKLGFEWDEFVVRMQEYMISLDAVRSD